MVTGVTQMNASKEVSFKRIYGLTSAQKQQERLELEEWITHKVQALNAPSNKDKIVGLVEWISRENVVLNPTFNVVSKDIVTCPSFKQIVTDRLIEEYSLQESIGQYIEIGEVVGLFGQYSVTVKGKPDSPFHGNVEVIFTTPGEESGISWIPSNHCPIDHFRLRGKHLDIVLRNLRKMRDAIDAYPGTVAIAVDC